MPYYVGLDASKQSTSICVIGENGEVAGEGVVASEPKAIVRFLRGEGRRYKRVGIESWTMTPWLFAGLAKAGLPVVCIETRQSSAVLKAARPSKSDRNDARGIAEIMRAGIYKSVHVKSTESRRIGAMLTARKLLRTKVVDIENGVRGLLLSFGVKLPAGGTSSFENRVACAAKVDGQVRGLIEPLMLVRRQLLDAVGAFQARLAAIAADDPVCRLLVTAPGIGALTALEFKAAVDEPRRFPKSRNVGPHFGLTPRSHQSGEHDLRRGITKCGDNGVRKALYLSAAQQFRKRASPSPLRNWAHQIAERRGRKKAIVALARRLAVILHRMWVTETEFRWAA